MLWFDRALLPDGWAERVRLTVTDGLIATLETGVEAQLRDRRHAVALPGLSNLHSHAFQRGMAGLTERRGSGPDSFWTWRETMYRFVDRIDPDGLAAIAAMAFVEMLEGGFTRVGEFHYLHHDPAGRAYADPAAMGAALGRAAAQTGIALTLLPVFYAQGGFGGQPAGAHCPARSSRLRWGNPFQEAVLSALTPIAAVVLAALLAGCGWAPIAGKTSRSRLPRTSAA